MPCFSMVSVMRTKKTSEANMKEAKFTVVSMEFECPYCGCDIPSPDGRLYWTACEINGSGDLRCPTGHNSSVPIELLKRMHS